MWLCHLKPQVPPTRHPGSWRSKLPVSDKAVSQDLEPQRSCGHPMRLSYNCLRRKNSPSLENEHQRHFQEIRSLAMATNHKGRTSIDGLTATEAAFIQC